MSLQSLKTDKRKIFQRERNSITEDYMHNASKKVEQSGFDLIQKLATKDTIIAGYYPYGHEMNPLPLMERLAKSGFTITLPRITNDILLFHKWDFLKNSLIANKQHPQIREVRHHVNFCIPEILLVPLVAFDREKNRLGQGGGYYDRTIDILPEETITIGLGYERQLSKEILPTGKYDCPMDYVLTENCCH